MTLYDLVIMGYFVYAGLMVCSIPLILLMKKDYRR